MTSSLAALLFVATLSAPASQTGAEAQISLDVKNAPIVDIISALAEAGRFQVVFDPAPPCPLTLKLNEVRWRIALEASLRACRLAYEEDGAILRIAPVERLGAESAERRKLADERARSGAHTVTAFRLSYARAAEVAPIVKRLLGPRGDVVYDARTNTLIIVD